MRFRNILFVCSGNICRSPMAEGLLKKMFEERRGEASRRVHILSAGVSAFGGYATAEAIQVMRDEGVDLSNFRSKQLTMRMVEEADLILTMKRSHKFHILSLNSRVEGRVFTLKEFAGEKESIDIADPYGKGIEAYNTCAIEIKGSLNKAFERIVNS